MTNLPDDRIDPYESRLARRVSDFAEQAVRPADHAAIATAAREGARRRTISGRLFGSTAAMTRASLVLVGTIVAGTALGVFLSAGGNGFVLSGTNDPAASPTAVPGAAEACAADDLSGAITAWEGAAGHRIATVEVHNRSLAACLLRDVLRPALVDDAGHALIVGARRTGREWLIFPPGAYATTLVNMSNYCGEAPSQGLRIRFYLDDELSVEYGPATSVAGAVEPPPCMGSNAAPAIEMQVFRLK